MSSSPSSSLLEDIRLSLTRVKQHESVRSYHPHETPLASPPSASFRSSSHRSPVTPPLPKSPTSPLYSSGGAGAGPGPGAGVSASASASASAAYGGGRLTPAEEVATKLRFAGGDEEARELHAELKRDLILQAASVQVQREALRKDRKALESFQRKVFAQGASTAKRSGYVGSAGRRAASAGLRNTNASVRRCVLRDASTLYSVHSPASPVRCPTVRRTALRSGDPAAATARNCRRGRPPPPRTLPARLASARAPSWTCATARGPRTPTTTACLAAWCRPTWPSLGPPVKAASSQKPTRCGEPENASPRNVTTCRRHTLARC